MIRLWRRWRNRHANSVRFRGKALGELRNVISDLRPPQLDELGLAAGLRWYVQSYPRRRKVDATFTAEGDDSCLPADYGALLRIAQEALTNIAKHAHATQINITLLVDKESVEVVVTDNSMGFDPTLPDHLADQPTVGWGIVGMHKPRVVAGRQVYHEHRARSRWHRCAS